VRLGSPLFSNYEPAETPPTLPTHVASRRTHASGTSCEGVPGPWFFPRMFFSYPADRDFGAQAPSPFPASRVCFPSFLLIRLFVFLRSARSDFGAPPPPPGSVQGKFSLADCWPEKYRPSPKAACSPPNVPMAGPSSFPIHQPSVWASGFYCFPLLAFLTLFPFSLPADFRLVLEQKGVLDDRGPTNEVRGPRHVPRAWAPPARRPPGSFTRFFDCPCCSPKFSSVPRHFFFWPSLAVPPPLVDGWNFSLTEVPFPSASSFFPTPLRARGIFFLRHLCCTSVYAPV